MRTITRLGIAAVLAVVLATVPAVGSPASAKASNLHYFGYFATRLTEAGGNHLAEVAGRSNLNWVQISDPTRYAPEVLDGCSARGCIISTGNEFFHDCDTTHSASCALYPDYVARFGKLANAIRSRIDKVGAFYLMDEPQWRGATPAELETAARTIKSQFPGIPVMMVEAGPQVSASYQVPASVDWVGFDWYCQPFSTIQTTLATLGGRIHAGQALWLVAESAPLAACGGAAGHATDAEIAALQLQYLALAESDPRVIGILAFGFWTSGYGSAQLPKTVAAHQQIFSRLVKPEAPAEIARQRGRLSRKGVASVRVGCPAASGVSCSGTLQLTRGTHGRALGTSSFVIAPGAHKTVRVKVSRKARRHLIRAARRPHGVKVLVLAQTAAGVTTTKVRLRAR